MNAPSWGLTPDCATLTGLDEERQAEIVQMATDFLWRWTGQAYGVSTESVRPCRQGCTGGHDGAFPNTVWHHGKVLPVLIGGHWTNLGCGRCGDDCSCSGTPALRLPGPVQSIEEVLINGEVLPASAYRVDNQKYLVRLDGGAWPTCQDMASPVSEPGTWQVTYTRGVPVPDGGKVAAEMLACEFAKAIVQPSACALPKRVQSINRQGVSVTLLDDFKSLTEGGTGIWLIDSWVASVTKPVRQSSVHSPDLPRPRFRRTTWGGP